MPYDACFRIGKIDTVNDDGSYEVTEKGKPNPISSVQSGDGGTYMVGESVNLASPQGNRGTVMIYGKASYQG